jgi:hypothetical protein
VCVWLKDESFAQNSVSKRNDHFKESVMKHLLESSAAKPDSLDALVIESGHYTAGLALKNGTHYRFLASDDMFWPLEGMLYENLHQLQNAVDRQRQAIELAA